MLSDSARITFKLVLLSVSVLSSIHNQAKTRTSTKGGHLKRGRNAFLGWTRASSWRGDTSFVGVRSAPGCTEASADRIW
ncbi:hypothetical protein BJV74DRAFT_858422 [Russula compacta]|nr:hypothetical protein BJV74DRAFT_858422 [Russula compacta]